MSGSCISCFAFLGEGKRERGGGKKGEEREDALAVGLVHAVVPAGDGVFEVADAVGDGLALPEGHGRWRHCGRGGSWVLFGERKLRERRKKEERATGCSRGDGEFVGLLGLYVWRRGVACGRREG